MYEFGSFSCSLESFHDIFTLWFCKIILTTIWRLSEAASSCGSHSGCNQVRDAKVTVAPLAPQIFIKGLSYVRNHVKWKIIEYYSLPSKASPSWGVEISWVKDFKTLDFLKARYGYDGYDHYVCLKCITETNFKK